MSQTNGSAGGGGVPMENLSTDKQPGMTTEMSEQVLLMDKKRRVSIKTAVRLRNFTIVISWITVIYLGIMSIITFVLAIHSKNSSGFAFALDALLDCVSSAVVIWRYSGSAAALYSSRKEKIACLVLGSLFILSFASILSRSLASLIRHVHPTRSNALWIISIMNTIACMGFLISKAWLARKMESISIGTDAVNSGLGFVMAFSAVITDWAYNMHNSVWYVDSVVGCVCSVFLLIYGVWLIVYELCIAKHDEGTDTELYEE